MRLAPRRASGCGADGYPIPVRDLDLDAWLPDPQVRSRHRRTARVEPAALWSAARDVRLDETSTLGALVRWRIPGTEPGVRFRELLADYPFCLLDEGDGWSLSGLCGRIWTLARDYPRLDGPGTFRAWREPGTVRVLFAHWIEPARFGSALVSEARVAPVDTGAALRLRALWLLVGRFERLIGAEPLRLAADRATRGGRDDAPGGAQPNAAANATSAYSQKNNAQTRR